MSPATCLFVQQLIQSNIKENITVLHDCLFVRGVSGDEARRVINWESVSMSWRHHQHNFEEAMWLRWPDGHVRPPDPAYSSPLHQPPAPAGKVTYWICNYHFVYRRCENISLYMAAGLILKLVMGELLYESECGLENLTPESQTFLHPKMVVSVLIIRPWTIRPKRINISRTE